MSSPMGPLASIVELPEAQNHVMLDQPLAFVAALRMLLDSWTRAEPWRRGRPAPMPSMRLVPGRVGKAGY
jgi:hypothetical protein